MRRTLPLTIAALALTGCQDQSPTTANKQAEAPAPAAKAPAEPANLLDRSQAGQSAPTTAFLAPDGSKVTIASFRGKPLLLNLWATWCGPCKIEMPHLDTLAGREKGLQVVTVSQDSGAKGKAAAEAFFADQKFAHLKSYTDPDVALTEAFVVNAMPTTILYDSEGKEVWRLLGPEEWTGTNAAALIGEAS